MRTTHCSEPYSHTREKRRERKQEPEPKETARDETNRIEIIRERVQPSAQEEKERQHHENGVS
jgi:hypothetical protein